MTNVEIQNGVVVARIQGMDQVLALKSELSIPLRLHVPGTDMPCVVMAGTFVFLDGEHAFWDVHDPDQTVVIQLDDERFANLVLEVEDPQSTAIAINAAVAGAGPPEPGT